MKKLLLAGAAMLALFGGTATAADLSRAPPPVYRAPPPVYVYSWTGCYIGGNVGGLWVNKELTGTVLGQSFSADANSWAAGLQTGCDYQFAGGWVVGIQGDYDWTDAHADRTGIFFVNSTQSFSAKSVSSVTGRVGYAWDRFLGYVKGGGAWERDNLTFTFPGVIATFDNTRSGWTIGVGGEYAFTNWLTGFVEYDYYDFGSRSDNVVCGPVRCFVGGPTSLPFDVKETKNVVKVGLNWKFGPIVRPY